MGRTVGRPGSQPTMIPGGGEGPQTSETESGEGGAHHREMGVPPRDAGACAMRREGGVASASFARVSSLGAPGAWAVFALVGVDRMGAGTAPSLASGAPCGTSGQSWPHAARPRSPASWDCDMSAL